jgi:integrase
MGSPHTVPLSRQALEVLESLRLITGQGELLFPRRWDTSQSYPVSNMIFLMALRRIGYGGVMTGHGFRGIASTILHENAFPHEHIEIQLAHSKRDSVSAAYNHALYLQPRAEMMQWYADYLERAQRGATVAAVNTVTA